MVITLRYEDQSMKITQLRNATMVIHSGDNVILVDPMLAPKAAITSLKYLTTRRRRNPLVDLPSVTDKILSQVTHCLITHCQKGHFDHLDRAGVKWLRANNIPVYCPSQDVEYLLNKGLNVHSLKSNTKNQFLYGTIELIPCIHGEGFMGKLMAHGYGFLIRQSNEPSLYISGDTLLTNDVRNCIQNDKPDWIVIPAGGARFDLGKDIIMGLDEALQVGAMTQAHIIANHLESLDHCPVTREELRIEVNNRNWSNRFHIPEDGESLQLSALTH